MANGIVDTKTGRLSPPSREVLCTMQCGVSFDPAARAPVWEEFIRRIANGDAEFIAYIQRALGYALTGSTREQCFFVLYGTGANGKSTLLETVLYVMGDYATAADFSLLTTKPGGGPSEGFARLRGKRLVTAVESEEGIRFNETLLKQLTGGDTITARYLYQSSFSFKPSFKLILATNYKPRIGGTDEGIWRRVRLLPLTVQIPLDERDTALFEKLTEEGSGILNWLLRGALAWRASELGEAQAVASATAEYRGEQDAIGAFITELCEVAPEYTVSTNLLYESYVDFCKENDRNHVGTALFGKALNRQGLSKARGARGEYFRRGIRLKEAM
jgi:putative DNA primase/helicase